MTLSKMTTAGQVDKAIALYRALLEKHSGEFSAEAVQMVLGQSELAGEQFSIFRRRVEMVSNFITRQVNVDRSRSPQEALKATGRVQYTNGEVVDAMPRGDENCQSDEGEVVFFKPDLSERSGYLSDDELEQEFEWRGLKPCDPISLSAINEADPAFADEKPHGTHWKDAKDNWCFAMFDRWSDGRRVSVNRDGFGWRGHWWFAGVRK